MMGQTRYAFDLDGTITLRELLPAIAEECGLGREMALLTRLTMDGAMDFAASFRLRFAMLRAVPLEVVRRIASSIPLDRHIASFIAENADHCAVVTGNLDCWIAPITEKLGCAVYCSRSEIRDGSLRLQSILDKGEAVRHMAATGAKVIAVGDAANDVPMFRAAHKAIAYAGLRRPPQSLADVADHVAHDAAEMCRMLRDCR